GGIGTIELPEDSFAGQILSSIDAHLESISADTARIVAASTAVTGLGVQGLFTTAERSLAGSRGDLLGDLERGRTLIVQGDLVLEISSEEDVDRLVERTLEKAKQQWGDEFRFRRRTMGTDIT
ncbi:MAG: hypothetical protein HOP28_12155, partial [Gemmatimonadales bacterium]|nr:hypothetical protein [Gemmatimonadales bacterium]